MLFTKPFTLAFFLVLFATTAHGQAYLTPLDFGLKVGQHGLIDYQNHPPNVLIGQFNGDKYPDILRFNGSTLELFLFDGKGYPVRPQGERSFSLPIKSLRPTGNRWAGQGDVALTLADGSVEIIPWRNGSLDVEPTEGFFAQSAGNEIPRRISEFDFQIVWESEQKPWGMNRCAVGDLDNDGQDEIASWWIREEYADTAWIVIYKSVGDNQYELLREEQLYMLEDYKAVSQMIIGDIDGNGQNELIYTGQYCYFWEFDEAMNYTIWRADFTFPYMAEEIMVTDVDQDGIAELAAVTSSWFEMQGAYHVWQFDHKAPGTENIMYFNTVIGFNTQWPDIAMDVGDFDNDGRVDIVGGNAGFVVGYDPIDLPYYTYEPSSPGDYQANWLYTGLPMSCVAPVIGDFDGDGNNELFVGGLYPNGGAAFLWKPTGFQTGYVLDVDTTASPGGPDEAIFATVDAAPAAISTHVWPAGPGQPDASWLLLWSWQEPSLINSWQSDIDDSAGYQNPYCADPDLDGKKSIMVSAGLTGRYLLDWEQTSATVSNASAFPLPNRIALHPVYPNPFNNSTCIAYDLPKRTDAALNVYDIRGRLIQSWMQPHLAPGRYSEVWRPENTPSGIYLIILSTEESVKMQKCILLK